MSDDEDEREGPVLTVYCQEKKAQLYLGNLARLTEETKIGANGRQSIRGACLLHKNHWISPNQFVIGICGLRDARPAWKTILKHNGVPMKRLLDNGIVVLDDLACYCEGCTGKCKSGGAAVKNNVKKPITKKPVAKPAPKKYVKREVTKSPPTSTKTRQKDTEEDKLRRFQEKEEARAEKIRQKEIEKEKKEERRKEKERLKDLPTPIPKQQLDREAWEWAEYIDPDNVLEEHVEAAYRIHLDLCPREACRRNCKGSPHCLNAMGEREWLGELDESFWHDIEEPESEKREEGAFVGLKNLGATCYVNTFIQVWFHNPVFRNAVFAWRGEEEKIAGVSSNGELETALPQFGPQQNPAEMAMAEDRDLMPTTVCGHLQHVFGLLQFSNRRYIDPSSLIHRLELDTGEQQDAQEFSKLFMSVLEGQLSQAGDSSTPGKNLIQEQFQGEYAYVTTCSACSGVSQRPSDYYELDLNIKDHSNLHECIQEFLEVEKLEDDNKYMCGACNKKQNAERQIRLKRLPKVLNLQLLRFVFDRKSGHKKKLNTFIQFPEILDLSEYVGEEEDTSVYDLTAVLIHRGPSAYSGHYVAHIKDPASESWYKFNDEEIEKMSGGKNLQLGNEEDLAGTGVEGKGPKKPKTSKGYHCSRNAYMLVYVRRIENMKPPKPVTLKMLPERLRLYIEMDRRRFEDWIKEMKVMMESNVINGKERQQQIRHLLEIMPVTEEGDYEWIDASWIHKWLEESQTQSVPAIDNKSLSCPHGKIDPDQVCKLKCISAESAELLYDKYSGGPRLKGSEMMCHPCVVERCRVIRTKARVVEDQKVITAALKANTEPCEDSYWVSKASLRSWKRLALEKIEDKDTGNGDVETKNGNVESKKGETEAKNGEEETKVGDAEMKSGDDETKTGDAEAKSGDDETKSGGTDTKCGGTDTKSGDADSEVSMTPQINGEDKVKAEAKEESDELGFNEDIVCDEHGQLVMEEGCRRLVLGDVWRRLRAYFPEAPEFKYGVEGCTTCQQEAEQAEEQKELGKKAAQEQKAALSDLYFDKNRPLWTDNINTLNIIPKDFLDAWRKFIKEPSRHKRVTTLSNSSFLCPHGRFMHDPETVGLTPSSKSLVYVYPAEWTELHRIMTTDVEVVIRRVTEDSGHISFITTPDICTECQLGRQEAERQAETTYKDAVIFVRRMTPDNEAMAMSGDIDVPPGDGPEPGEKDDPEFCQLQANGKRKAVDGAGPSVEKVARMDNSSRRSSRHRRVRGEKEVTVSATTKLWDLRIKLMRDFSAAPMDQHMYMAGTLLFGNERTLGELGVTPNSIIYLKVDEPCDDPMLLDEVSKAACPEEGFKGTGLLGGTLTT